MKANPVTALLVLGSIACAAPVTAQSAGSSIAGPCMKSPASPSRGAARSTAPSITRTP